MIPATFTTNNDRTSRVMWQAFPETCFSSHDDSTIDNIVPFPNS